MKLKDIMTTNVQTISPDSTLQAAAIQMSLHNVGMLPVTNVAGVLGTITDRDLALRAVAEGRDLLTTKVKDVMTAPPPYVVEDATIEQACKVMRKNKVRRLIVLTQSMNLVGIVSVTDMAIKGVDRRLSTPVMRAA